MVIISREGVYLCADIGINWRGDLSTMERMIEQAAGAGFDAVKLQWFDRDFIEEQDYEPDLKRQLYTMCLNETMVMTIASMVRARKMELVVTPFFLHALEKMPEDVDGIKIRAADCFRTDLIRKAQTYDLPVYISQPVIDGYFKKPEDVPEGKFFEVMSCLMMPDTYGVMCTPKYPPESNELHLSRVVDFNGYSSHYPDPAVPLMAATIAVNAVSKKRKRRFYLEVHMVPGHHPDDSWRFPDLKVSLDAKEMSQLAKGVSILEEGV